MSIIGSNILAGASGQAAGGYEIEQSLRFDGSSAYLSRTPSSAGNRKTWTWSGWVKRANLGAYQRILGGYVSATFDFGIGFNDLDNLNFYSYSSGLQASLLSTDRFRDTSAWYHIVYAVDTTQGTSSDRVKIYVNNKQITSFSVTTYPGPSVDLSFNSTNIQRIGQSGYPSEYFGGYLSEVNFIDGSALDPTDFGELDDNGVWRPIEYAGSYTGNSFYLKFDAADVDGDSSGLGNDWTASAGISTSGTGTDVMSDTPTTNWATLNPLDKASGVALSDGNLGFTRNGTAAQQENIRSTFFVSSGKYYWEYTTMGDNGTIAQRYGIATSAHTLSNTTLGSNAFSWAYEKDGDKRHNNVSESYGTGWGNSGGDIIGVALDMDAGTLGFYLNGTSQGQAYSGITDTVSPCFQIYPANVSGSGAFNAGQRPFAYTPPTGFNELNTANLPAPDIADGSEYFNTVLWTGDNTDDRSITVADNSGNSWQPDWVWYKRRNLNASHLLFDAVRGATKALSSNNTDTESTESNALQAFESTGFQVGSDANSNSSSYNYVAWNWKAGGSGSSNTDGSITSTVSANPSAGFSIVSYTASGTDNDTVGHGLGVEPALHIVKSRDGARDWLVYTREIDGSLDFLRLNTTAAAANSSANAPTSTVFSLYGADINTAGEDCIAYCFAEVEGYSKFGSYTGNGSSDGPFVYCGFRPAFVMFKKSDNTGSWWMFDSARNEYNYVDKMLEANSSSSESGIYIDERIDILSNGFKLRDSNSGLNGNTSTFIFMALAENPFGGSGVSPATAR